LTKYIFILALLFSNLFSKQITFYAGDINKNNSEGIYEGILFTDSSEDEIITYKLGLKKINFYDYDYAQSETFISIKRELDLEKSLEIAMINIDNDEYGGEIYMSILHINSFSDYKAGLYFSNYKNVKVYQANVSLKSFISTSPFYIRPQLFFIKTSEQNFYKALEFKVGYIKKTRNLSIAPLIGKIQYLVKDNNYYSCNLGLRIKYGLKIEYLEQISKRFLTKLEYTYHHLGNDENLHLISTSLTYRY
jgi:hypothetical protein